MPKVVVYVPAEAWRLMEERGIDPAETVRGLARIGCGVILGFEEKINWDDFQKKFPSSGAAVDEQVVSGSAANISEEPGGLVAPTRVRPERAAPGKMTANRRMHPCKHHLPPSKHCPYGCDG